MKKPGLESSELQALMRARDESMTEQSPLQGKQARGEGYGGGVRGSQQKPFHSVTEGFNNARDSIAAVTTYSAVTTSIAAFWIESESHQCSGAN